MNQLLFYLLQVIAASGLLYGYYHVALRNKKFHRYNRFYLLMAVAISSLIPFLNIPVYFSEKEAGSSVVLQTLQVISSPLSEESVSATTYHEAATSSPSSAFTVENILYLFYLLIILFFVAKVLLSLNKIKTIIKNNPAEQIDRIKFINTDEPGTPFSFFRWLFWDRKIDLDSEKGEQIFRHELFHIQQKHSWDVIFMEIVSTIFWINPFFHLMKKELKAIHEFLADEFAIKENRNWQYAELLLMQVLNTNNQLVNPFFHNQVKRRIAMITTSTKPSYRYFRKLMILPVAAIIVFLFAFSYNKKQTDTNEIEKATNTITVVIDAGHGGTDKGAKTKDGKYNEGDLTLAIAKKIQTLAPGYNVNVVMTREDDDFPGNATNKNDALRQRVSITNNSNPSAFVSIHINSSPAAAAKSGIDACISNERDNERDVQLAASVLGKLKDVYVTNEEIKRRRDDIGVYVIDKPQCASLLLECGYITNPNDIAFITKEANQEDVARAILKGLVTFANNKAIDSKTGLQQIVTDTSKQLHNALVIIDGVVQQKRGIQNIDTNIFPKKEFNGTVHVLNNKEAVNKYGEKGKEGVIELFFDQDRNEIIDTIPKVDTIYWTKEVPTPDKKSPTAVQLKSWEDANMYGVWIDRKRINNSELSKYDPSDFVLFYNSKLSKNAVNYGKHYYQIDLYTAKEYDRAYGPGKPHAPMLIRKVTTDADSVIHPQPLIVLNGNPMPDLKLSELGKMIAPDNIESITVLKGQTAIEKYGDKAKAGVLEIKSKEFTVGPKDEKIKEIRVEEKPLQEDDNKVFVKVEIEPTFPGGHKGWTNFLTRNLIASVPVKKGAKPGTYTVVVQFIVDKNGTVSDVRALTNHGFGMEEEAVRVISKGPHWVPGIQNGRIVKAYRKQPVTFVIAAQ